MRTESRSMFLRHSMKVFNKPAFWKKCGLARMKKSMCLLASHRKKTKLFKFCCEEKIEKKKRIFNGVMCLHFMSRKKASKYWLLQSLPQNLTGKHNSSKYYQFHPYWSNNSKALQQAKCSWQCCFSLVEPMLQAVLQNNKEANVWSGHLFFKIELG